MNKKTLKKFTAFALAGTMALGSAMTVLADDAGVATGTGSYEGGEMKYPTLSVTLPTIPSGTYDYIADPNGLIAATNSGKYTGATFSGSTGIFFQTSNNTYTEKSAAQTVTNENAQDIDVTVKLEQQTAGDETIKYSNTATFESDDKENKLYLAVTDDAASDPNAAALSDGKAAVVTATVAGVPGNYEAAYANGKYEYTKKSNATGWKDCSFILTGAVNTNATWGDDLTFPTIKVTWSYEEHSDDVAANGTVSKGTLWMSLDGSRGFSARPSSVTVDGVATTAYTYATNGWMSMAAPTSGSVIRITVGDTTYRVVAP